MPVGTTRFSDRAVAALDHATEHHPDAAIAMRLAIGLAGQLEAWGDAFLMEEPPMPRQPSRQDLTRKLERSLFSQRTRLSFKTDSLDVGVLNDLAMPIASTNSQDEVWA